MDWPSILKTLAFWGPGAIIAALIILAFYRLADKFIEKFVSGFMEIGHEFISAQKEQAASMAKMAQGTEGLRDCINNFVNRDNQEHREIIILLKYTREQINQITETMDAIAAHMNKEQTHDIRG
jgi:hypothetical protein